MEGSTAPVVLVHGILVRGYIMRQLAHALQAAGYHPHIYSYPSLRYSLAEQAERLADYCHRVGLHEAHFVAHSMGGLVLRHLAAMETLGIPSAVTLATPHRGSHCAVTMQRKGLGWLLGRTYPQGLDGELPPWPANIPLGSLAGDRSVGLGRLFTRFDEANDGTVLVSETRMDDLRDHRVLHHSHTGILYAEDAAREVEHFLRQHCFSPAR